MKRTIIIAEAGVNHNGSFELAMQLVAEAAKAGADYVKFQTFKAESLVAPSARKAVYQQENCGGTDDSQLAMLRELELSSDSFNKLAAECRRLGIGFMSTPFDTNSVDLLSSLGMDYWKIPSGEITNLPLLRKIGSMCGRVIMSTGMSTLDDISAALAVLETAGTSRNDIYLLHCTTQYPAPFDSVNLSAMGALRQLGCRGVGYSDHTRGIAIPIAAAALGAEVIEKHFTIDRNLPGPDHKASLEPSELAEMVRAIRDTDLSLGDGVKRVTEAESPNIAVARKSIVAARDIYCGEVFTEENLTCKRPGTGISPMLWDKIVGTKSTRNYRKDEMI